MSRWLSQEQLPLRADSAREPFVLSRCPSLQFEPSLPYDATCLRLPQTLDATNWSSTPTTHVEAVKAAIFATGAGITPTGKYSHCCFESKGVGQFKPEAEKGATPNIGQKEQDGSGGFRLERVEETRCEIVCVGLEVAHRAVEALKREHPYEEPGYEVYKSEIF